MTANRRIFLNIVATYGRSLYALALGLISARWVLTSLGTIDYGLYGVIAGMTAFISFFNGLLGSSIGRFYAVNVGRTMLTGGEQTGLEECRKWFNTAISIHTVIPVILILVGYPIGVWAIRNWMTVPVERVADSVWVFRFVCFSCFVGMLNVPFSAMYGAKQYIAELTIYSFVSTTVNFAFLCYMISHPGNWLTRYAFFTMLLAVVPQLIICIRAFQVFEECRIKVQYLWSWARIRQLVSYAGWLFFGSTGVLLRNQGFSLLINKCFGPILNATLTIANSVAAHTDSLSASVNGAFSPAVMNLEGKGDRQGMIQLACMSSKVGSIVCLFFMLPLSVEIDVVLKLWLKTPPILAAEACLMVLAILAMDQLARGLNLAITADGRIGLYNAVIGSMHILSLPVAIIVVCIYGGGFLSVLSVLVIAKLIGIVTGAIIVKHIIDFPVRSWILDLCVPLAVVTAISVAVGIFARKCFWQLGLIHIPLSFLCVELVFVSLVWRIALNEKERQFLLCKILTRFTLFSQCRGGNDERSKSKSN